MLVDRLRVWCMNTLRGSEMRFRLLSYVPPAFAEEHNLRGMLCQLALATTASAAAGVAANRVGNRIGIRLGDRVCGDALCSIFLALPVAALLPLLFVNFTDGQQWWDIFVLLAMRQSMLLGAAFQPIGLTGSIATGKSSVSRILQDEYKQPIVDVDKIAHDILKPTYAGRFGAYREVVQEFGERILKEDRTIDRGALGDIIFKDKARRRKLNGITHPKIRYIMILEMLRLKAWLGHSQVWVDVPLLFESPGLRYLFGTIVVVSTTPKLQRERLQRRNPELSKSQCDDRIKSQMPLEEKRRLADVVISNDGSYVDLEASVASCCHKLSGNVFDELFILTNVIGTAASLAHDDHVAVFIAKIVFMVYSIAYVEGATFV